MKKMTNETLAAYAELTRNADAWYKLWGQTTDLGQSDLAEHCKFELEQLIKDLDTIGDCGHKYRGINC
jgi:hypothetical protein